MPLTKRLERAGGQIILYDYETNRELFRLSEKPGNDDALRLCNKIARLQASFDALQRICDNKDRELAARDTAIDAYRTEVERLREACGRIALLATGDDELASDYLCTCGKLAREALETTNE